MKSCLYLGDVGHYRYQPQKHGFGYRLFHLYLDLDELPKLFSPFLLWSATRPALAWFRRQDHMGDPRVSLKESVRQLIREKTGKHHKGPIRLLTHLRYFGYCMNPVSFYYCWDEADSTLEYIVAEVHNTPWGETHCYVLDCQSAVKEGECYVFPFAKEFHVSPFMDMQQHYVWKLSAPSENLLVNMDSYEGEQRMFNARMRLEYQTITQRSMAMVLIRFPLMTFKVIGAIYWQALLLRLKNVPFYTHPKNLKHEISQ